MSALFFHKLLPLLVLPPGLGLLLVALGLLLRRHALAWSGFTLLLLFSMPVVGDGLLRLLEGPPRREAAASFPDADAIMVLGGMVEYVPGASQGEWGEAADRFEAGVELYRAGRAPLLLFSAGRLPWQRHLPTEGSLLRERACRLGLPDSALALTGEAANTVDEARELQRMLAPGSDVILVTSAFHMPRAKLLFQRAGFRVTACRVDFRSSPLKRRGILSFLPDADAMANSFLALRELLGLLWYSVRS